MSNHDHLDPLPEATPGVIVRMFIGGLIVGAIAVFADYWITQTLLGFESPFIIFSLAVISIFVISGSMKDNSLGVTLPLLGGIVVGVLATNALRVFAFGHASLLSGVGM